MVRIASPFGRTVPVSAVDRPPSRGAIQSSAVAAGTIAAAFLLASAAVSLYLAQVSSIAGAGYQLEQLEAERREWIARNGQLELEIAKRQSLVWSELEATQRMGMTRADRPVYVQVDSALLSCEAGGASCGSVSAPPDAQQASPPPRPAPGNPAQIVAQIRGWLATLQRSEE